MTTPTFDEIEVGTVLPARSYPVRRFDLVRYAGASGDFNLIHWNERFATAVGLPNVIAHGMFTMATAVRIVTDWNGDPGAVVDYSVRFTRPVVVPDDDAGATIEVTAQVVSKDAAARTVKVQIQAGSGGQNVLGKASAVVRLP